MTATAVLEPASLVVEPGGAATVRLRIRNTGTIVDRLDVGVVGPAAGWITADPSSSSLFPGQEAVVTLRFSPPRAPVPRAGTYPFGVRIVPAADPAGAIVEEGRVTVSPFGATVAEIAPQTSRGSRVGRHDVTVDNRGNGPVEVALTASDPDRLLRFHVQPERQVVAPGERTVFGLEAVPTDTFLRGARRSIPFAVEVRPGAEPPIALRGTLSQGPTLPGWVLPAAGLAALALVAVLALPSILGGNPPPDSRVTDAPPTGQPTDAPLTPVPTPVESTTAEPASAPPTPIAPLARIRILDMELEDLDNQRGIPREEQNPSFSFMTDGPGDVMVMLNRVDGDGGEGVELCVGPQGRRADCETLTGAGPVVVDNEETGTVSWVASVQSIADGYAPFIDLSFEFYARRPAFTITDNAEFFGSAAFPSAGYSTFTALVTAREPTQLGVDIDFGGAFPSFGWSLRDTGTFGTPPPLTVPDANSRFVLPPFTMAPPNTYEFRFVGISTFDGSPVIYRATFTW